MPASTLGGTGDPLATTAAEPSSSSAADPSGNSGNPSTATTSDDSAGEGASDSEGAGEASGGETDSNNAECAGSTASITGDGNVVASSVFVPETGPAFSAPLSVDGNVATSWFSAGPKQDGAASTYEWRTQVDHCIDRITIISNAMNAEPSFRTGFGFESVQVDVVNAAGVTVYTEEVDLTGTPDPDVMVDPGGVLGNQVVLRLLQHESQECGGFAELAIDGRSST